MRLVILLLFLLPLPLAANTTYRLDLTAEASCPGDVITVETMASNGMPAPDVELRLVLYEPYQGLRALKHTNASGQTFFELTRNGTYRIYVSTDRFNHEQYYYFTYQELCPPPPPKRMVVDMEISCDSRTIEVRVTDGSEPLEGVFVQSRHWSSMSGRGGTVLLPFMEDYFLSFEKHGYEPGTVIFNPPCPNP